MIDPVRIWRRWLALALLASLAGNLLLAGILIGGRLVGRAEAVIAAPGSVAGFGRRVAELPIEQRQVVTGALRDARSDIRPARQALVGARKRLAEAISAERYDPAAVAAAFAEVRRDTALLQERIQAAVVPVLGQLPLAARQRLVGSTD